MELILNEVQRWISTASIGELLFGSLLFLVLIEQILYLLPVSYVYQSGILFRQILISNHKVSFLTDKKTQPKNLSLRMNRDKSEIHLRNNYPFGSWGPLLFVGQIKLVSPNILNIRVGIFSLLLVISPLVISIYGSDPGPSSIFDLFYRLINLAILAALVGVLYVRLIKSLRI